MPTMEITDTEDVFRIEVAGMQWDIGAHVYEPVGGATAVGADGKKIGGFFLHGGQDDWRQMIPFAKTLASKFGWRMVLGTFPGRLYLQDPSRDWPGDTVNPDGTVRTPIWLKDELITPDQYEVVRDTSKADRYGTRTLVHAKPGTNFWFRMAAWPLATEVGFIEAMQRHFPIDDFSVYVHGHSTGGPQVCMLSQRVPNCEGILAMENSPFGYIAERLQAWGGAMGKIEGYERVKTAQTHVKRDDPFYELNIRTWRDTARYAGPEALGKEGPAALMRLPSLMEEILDEWHLNLGSPRFKCEYIITEDCQPALTQAAQVTAERLGLSEEETQEMVDHYLGLARELTGPGVKPVPNTLFGISKNSRDHSKEVYEEVVMSAFEAMNPAPRIALTHFQAGVHQLWGVEPNLPQGILPAVCRQWDQAIQEGFFIQN